jgi:uroporphyrinogen III methyltransferase/synthase
MQPKLDWYPAGPLAGTRILVTRTGERDEKFIAKIEALGGKTIQFPMITIVPPADFTRFDHLIRNLRRFQWLIFSSIDGVESFFNRLKNKYTNIQHLHNMKLAAMEQAAGGALEDLGFHVDFIPETMIPQERLDGLTARIETDESVLFAKTDPFHSEIPAGLIAQNIRVEELIVCHTMVDTCAKMKIVKSLQDGEVDCITFTSAFAVRDFVSIMGPEQIHLANRYPILCIGPVTEQEAYQSGLHVMDVADQYTVEGLIDKLIRTIRRIKELSGFAKLMF